MKTLKDLFKTKTKVEPMKQVKAENNEITKVVYFDPELTNSEIVRILNIAEGQGRLLRAIKTEMLGFPIVIASMKFANSSEHYKWIEKMGILKTKTRDDK